jgi:poly(A) polymerase
VALNSLEDYARFIARRLRGAGYDAYFVGGCVRDLLLNRMAKDFDIATDARPEEILGLFPNAGLVGAHFGVVLAREGRWQVEVATFRSDGAYSDGRRPDAVRFVSDPRHDAERRDFTINALFLDPETDRVMDFVGGRADLAARLIRAIGVPEERFQEDHLRLLRAVRFAARLGFTIEPATFEAMRRMAPLILLVAKERVREELDRILTEGAGGLDLLVSTGLLRQLVPEFEYSEAARARFARAHPGELSAPLAWAALLLDLTPAIAPDIAKRLRFSQAGADAVERLLANRERLGGVASMKTAERKRFLRDPMFPDHLTLHRLCGGAAPDLPPYTDAELHPKALLNGLDLIALGYPQGPLYSEILSALEDAQLEGELATREQAIAWLKRRF